MGTFHLNLTETDLYIQRCTIISQAIRIILNSNSHQPALLYALLETSLEHHLHESTILLSSLLSAAFGSVPICGAHPPICYAEHANFLQDLRTRWNAGGLSDQTFFDTFLGAFQMVRDPAVWCCKSVRNLVRVMCVRDFSGFMLFLGSFAQLVEEDNEGGSEAVQPWKWFHKWITIALDRLLSLDAVSLESGDSVAITESLVSMLTLGVRPEESVLDPLKADICEVNLCLATWWMVSLSSSAGPNMTSLVSRLKEALPKASTYTPLIEKIFLKASLEAAQADLKSVTRVLRSQGLVRLEASMWACALRQVEVPSCERLLSTRSSAEEIKKYRDQLVQAVEDAEQLCFGMETVDARRPQISVKTPVSKSGVHLPKSVWRWEAMVGCWIRRMDDPTPARKRRKPECVPSQRRVRHRASHPSLRSAPRTRIPKLSLEPLTQARDRDKAMERKGPFDNKSDSFKFASLLSDALANRTVVHGARAENISRRVSFEMDDMDLFACRTSSPLRL